MKRVMYGLLIVGLSLCTESAARAQYGWGATGTVNGTGTVTIERQPDRMRMQVDVLFRAGSVQDAVAGLQEQIEVARLQLVELGAIEDSIEVGEPSIDSQSSDQQRMMEQMIADSLRGSGRSEPEETEVSQPVTVLATVTAAWELDESDTAALLVETHELQKRIREADVAGSEEASQLTPEEEEILEEAQGLFGRSYSSSDEENPGEPIFSFVTNISDEEYREALAEAFQKAKAQAEELAAATGSELGSLESVSSSAEPGLNDYDYGYDYQSTYYRAYQQLTRDGYGAGADEAREAVGLKPGKVRFNVAVNAGFGLQEE